MDKYPGSEATRSLLDPHRPLLIAYRQSNDKEVANEASSSVEIPIPTHPDHSKDASTPPSYDPNKALFIREEKQMASRLEEDDLLMQEKAGKNAHEDEGLKHPRMLLGLLNSQAFLLPYTMLMAFAFLLTLAVELPKGRPVATLGYLLYLGLVNVVSFCAAMFDGVPMGALNLVVLTLKLLCNCVFGMSMSMEVFNADFCHKNFGADKVGRRQCLENVPMLRALVPAILMAQLAWEAYLLTLFAYRQCYLNELEGRNGRGKRGPFTGLTDVDTTVGHVMV
jgi:hypothetical protein